MSHPFLPPQNAIPPELRDALSPLFYLLGKLDGQISEDNQRQLLGDLLRFCPLMTGDQSRSDPPSSAQPPAAPLCRTVPPARPSISIVQVEGEEAFVLYHAQGRAADFSPSAVKLGPASIWEPLLHFQDAFRSLEKYSPLRAAALYLHCLTRLWVELLEAHRLDILAAEEFLRLYGEAMLSVESLAARCERCPRREKAQLR